MAETTDVASIGARRGQVVVIAAQQGFKGPNFEVFGHAMGLPLNATELQFVGKARLVEMLIDEAEEGFAVAKEPIDK